MGDAEALPVESASFDVVLSSFGVMFTANHFRAASEMPRVLRPGGSLHFVEHGRSPISKSARMQDRVTPVWKRAVGGCHLNRRIPELIENAGFRMEKLDSYKDQGPEVVARLYEGVAVKA